jgi:hypothetical protein
MLDSIAPPRLPAEYRGLARIFRAEVKSTDSKFNAVLSAIMKPLQGRLKRHPKLRIEQIAGAERVYRAMVPQAFRIGEIEVNRDRAAFSISEVRLTATWLRIAAWEDEDSEPGLAIARFRLELANGKLRSRCMPSALVSLHSLGRWFERSGIRDHAALTHDLAVLAEVGDDADDRVATPDSDGAWVGAVINIRGEGEAVRARSVRTWHP